MVELLQTLADMDITFQALKVTDAFMLLKKRKFIILIIFWVS